MDSKGVFLTLKLPGVRSKFKTKFYLIFLSKLQNFLQMFSFAIHSGVNKNDFQDKFAGYGIYRFQNLPSNQKEN